MVGKKKRSKRRTQLMGNHQKCWLWGRHAVLETLRAGRWRPLEVRLDPSGLEDPVRDEVTRLLDGTGLPIVEADATEMTRLCGSRDHQGIMARMPPFPYGDLKSVLQSDRPDQFYLILDGIQDPFNFGSILRSADLFGVSAVIVPEKGQAAVSSHVVRSSAGAVNYLHIVQVEDLVVVCGQLRDTGIRLLAATERGRKTPAETDLRGPIALLIGNEGSGLQPELLEACEEHIAIPQSGHVSSLNAAVAAGILCYEVRRQRDVRG